MTYRQCTLFKETSPDSRSWEVAYVPEELAVVGQVLKIRRDSDEWDDGWVVNHVGATASRKALEDRVWLRHRRATDVASGTFRERTLET